MFFTTPPHSSTCLISAPLGARLDTLRRLLKARGLTELEPTDLAMGTDLATVRKDLIGKADLVIGILTADQQAWSVFFEIGQAFALGRRILIISPPQGDIAPFVAQGLLVLRVALTDEEAIGFALNQVLAAPKKTPRQGRPPGHQATLGNKADGLISSLNDSSASRSSRWIQLLVADALQSAGADIVVESSARDRIADLAAWSDSLETLVGNPLPIEIKSRIRGKSEAQRAVQQLEAGLSGGSRIGMLVYYEGPPSNDRIWQDVPPNILVIRLRELLEALRTKSYPEVVRDLRNSSFHGSSR